jgi:hypothetical protein
MRASPVTGLSLARLATGWQRSIPGEHGPGSGPALFRPEQGHGACAPRA